MNHLGQAPSRSARLARILAFGLVLGCNQPDGSEEFAIVDITGTPLSGPSASLAQGARISLQDDGLVLQLGNARVSLPGEVSHDRGGDVTIRLSDERFAGREVRWESAGADRARLVWPGANGTTVMLLERVDP